MPEKLPGLRASEIITILKANAFSLVSQRGSHQKWRHSNSGKQVLVPFHKGKQLPLGTLKSIIQGSGISENDFHLYASSLCRAHIMAYT
jgi:predicted RNA binding protein YcfA (HicA-like mRNA interferase family)